MRYRPRARPPTRCWRQEQAHTGCWPLRVMRLLVALRAWTGLLRPHHHHQRHRHHHEERGSGCYCYCVRAGGLLLLLPLPPPPQGWWQAKGLRHPRRQAAPAPVACRPLRLLLPLRLLTAGPARHTRPACRPLRLLPSHRQQQQRPLRSRHCPGPGLAVMMVKRPKERPLHHHRCAVRHLPLALALPLPLAPHAPPCTFLRPQAPLLPPGWRCPRTQPWPPPGGRPSGWRSGARCSCPVCVCVCVCAVVCAQGREVQKGPTGWWAKRRTSHGAAAAAAAVPATRSCSTTHNASS